MILIICALKSEVNFIKKNCEILKEFGRTPFFYYFCKFKNINFLLGKSGLGKIRTASFLQYSIDNFKDISLIVNFGSCGAVADNVKIGELYLCKKAIEYDFETTKDFKPEFNINFEIDDFCLEKFSIKKGILASGTQNVDSEKKKKYLFKRFNAEIGDWEGSTVYQVSQLNNIKSIVFKAVTDYGNENLLEDFKKYSEKSLKENSLKVLNFLDFFLQHSKLKDL